MGRTFFLIGNRNDLLKGRKLQLGIELTENQHSSWRNRYKRYVQYFNHNYATRALRLCEPSTPCLAKQSAIPFTDLQWGKLLPNCNS